VKTSLGSIAQMKMENVLAKVSLDMAIIIMIMIIVGRLKIIEVKKLQFHVVTLIGENLRMAKVRDVFVVLGQ